MIASPFVLPLSNIYLVNVYCWRRYSAAIGHSLLLKVCVSVFASCLISSFSCHPFRSINLNLYVTKTQNGENTQHHTHYCQ